MNRESFLTLVNLYLDSTITPQERIRLENALRNRAEYRRLFTQYCRLHAASCQAFEQQIPQPVPQIAQSPRLWQKALTLPGLKLAAGLAVAALLAITWGQQGTSPAPVETGIAARPAEIRQERPATLPYRRIPTATQHPAQSSLLLLSNFEPINSLDGRLFDSYQEPLPDWLALDPELPPYPIKLAPVAAPNESPFADN